jgi:hypothetical protein
MPSNDDVLTLPTDHPEADSESGSSAPLTLPPLTVSALMVTKADLIAALRVYLPHLSDIEMIDADRFLLSIAGPPAENGSS